jgi:thiosulfate/3-mercaptopyruvate sulfurtransferase
VTGPLVSPDELASHLGDSAWRIFDCRHDLKQTEYGAKAYAKEHIPGALFLHLDRDLSGPTTGRNGRHPLPNADAFTAKMRGAGVDATTQIVAYDNEGSVFASRLWWMLRWLGHACVAVLDGGLPGWRRGRRPLDAALPTFPPGNFVGSPCGGTVSAEQVLANLGSSQLMLVDARSPERFRGEGETLDPVGGHIPGAVNRFYFDNLDDDGCFFKPADALRAEFAALLAGRAPTSVVQQCGSGVTACHNLLAMEIAGLSGSKLYSGSWSEWCADTARPVATGDA